MLFRIPTLLFCSCRFEIKKPIRWEPKLNIAKTGYINGIANKWVQIF